MYKNECPAMPCLFVTKAAGLVDASTLQSEMKSHGFDCVICPGKTAILATIFLLPI